MFVIRLNCIEGVILICTALRRTGGIPERQLAEGIEKTFIHVDEKGIITQGMNCETPPLLPGLKIVKGKK